MKILTKSLILLTLFTFEKNEKTIDLNYFSIQTPEEWRYIKLRGIDSFVGKIALKDKDTISFDFGHYSNDLEQFSGDYDYFVANDSVFYNPKYNPENEFDSKDADYIFFSKRDTFKINMLSDRTFHYEIIDKQKAKISTPKKEGIGLTGVYFEDVGNGESLQISGKNLTPQNQKEFLKAIRTIKFKK